MFAGTRGGYNRGFILKKFIDKPCDVSQLAEGLNLDYKTTINQFDILTKNGIITTQDDKNGKLYFLSKVMKENLNIFNKIWENIKINELEVRRNKNDFVGEENVDDFALSFLRNNRKNKSILILSFVAFILALFVPISTLFLTLVLVLLFVPPILALVTLLIEGIAVISMELNSLQLSEKKQIVISI
ncbi:MAG: hypothetical protein A2W22_01125 [Candidatus Levybacteria bacterium RBG_16_35_11]|nr:MAG: hypothetical protein A2W22_01125 [Candidatus Levybacteria bacterium RBG_16_35_11]